jgi:hypothetical protein
VPGAAAEGALSQPSLWSFYPMKTRELRVIEKATNKVIHTIDVSGRSDRAVDIIMAGAMRNLNHNLYRIDDFRIPQPEKKR